MAYTRDTLATSRSSGVSHRGPMPSHARGSGMACQTVRWILTLPGCEHAHQHALLSFPSQRPTQPPPPILPPRHIISRHITSYHIISHHITSCHIISHHITSYRIISHHLPVEHPGARPVLQSVGGEPVSRAPDFFLEDYLLTRPKGTTRHPATRAHHDAQRLLLVHCQHPFTSLPRPSQLHHAASTAQHSKIKRASGSPELPTTACSLQQPPWEHRCHRLPLLGLHHPRVL